MKITSKTTIEDVILMLKGIDFWDQLETVFIPVKIPELTYGQRIDLSSMNTRYDLLFIPQKVLLGLEEKEVMSKPFISSSITSWGMPPSSYITRLAKWEIYGS